MSSAPLGARSAHRVAAAAANADLSIAIARAPFTGTVASINYVPDAAITGANTDSRTLNVRNTGAAGTGTTVVASLAMTAGVNAAKFDEKAITLSGTAANLNVTEGDILEWFSQHVGSTGLADPGGLVIVEWARGSVAT